jgi:ParB family transcriptional regulator, chromosome partitioning protein
MPLPKIGERFKGAAADLQINQASRIAELEQKLLQMESVHADEASLESLRKELQGEFGDRQLKLNQIYPNPKQPRRIITEASIAQMAGTLEQDGQLSPITVVERSDSAYEIIDGHRRLAGAARLGWTTIKAVVIPRPKDMLRAALLTFFHREDLNPLDEAEAIAAYVEVEMDICLEDFRRLLATAVRRLERKQLSTQVKEMIGYSPDNRWQQLNDWGFTPQECQLFGVLLGLGVHPGSYKSNRLPLLNLPDDLKQAIIDGLGGDHALALSRLSSKTLKRSDVELKKLRTSLIKKIAIEKWTVAITRQKVTEMIANRTNNAQASESKEVRSLRLSIEKLDSAKLQSIPQDHLKALQSVVTQLQEQISLFITAKP